MARFPWEIQWFTPPVAQRGLDVVFQEDQWRARRDNAAEKLALLRRLAMSLLAKKGTKHASLRVKGRTAGWDDQLMAQILRPLIRPNWLQMSQVFASGCWLNLDAVEGALDCLIELVHGTVHRSVIGERVGQQFSHYRSKQTPGAAP